MQFRGMQSAGATWPGYQPFGNRAHDEVYERTHDEVTLPLSTSVQWSPGDQWFAVSELPQGRHVEYKHVLYDECTDKSFWVQEGLCSHCFARV